jgi:hypothetical protein
MKKFSLPGGTQVRVVNVNPRSERHGKTAVPAIDVKVRLTTANTILDDLKGPDFRQALYMRAEEAGSVAQADLEGVQPLTDTPFKRLNGVEPIHLEDELTGYAATFDIGTGRKDSVIELAGCKLSKFVVDPLQGGSVAIDFRIQASPLTEREFGKLCVLINAEVGLMLEAPVEPQAQLEDSSGEVADSAIAQAMKKAASKPVDARSKKKPT